jgi:hypothetical protein
MSAPTIVQDILQRFTWRIAAEALMMIEETNDATVVAPELQRVAVTMLTSAGPHVGE